MAIQRRVLHFRSDDLDEIVAEVVGIAASPETQRWVSMSPWVDMNVLPVTSILRRMFSGRGPKIPEVTWVPSSGCEPAELGVLHAVGPNALQLAIDRGVVVPESWRAVGDHSRRGLVFEIDHGCAARDLIDTAISLGASLAAVPIDDRWVAEISMATRP